MSCLSCRRCCLNRGGGIQYTNRAQISLIRWLLKYSWLRGKKFHSIWVCLSHFGRVRFFRLHCWKSSIGWASSQIDFIVFNYNKVFLCQIYLFLINTLSFTQICCHLQPYKRPLGALEGISCEDVSSTMLCSWAADTSRTMTDDWNAPR